jgi:hypothetical protein
MNKQLISVLTTAAIAATSLFISAGTSHADFNPAAPSSDLTDKTVDEPEKPTSEASDTLTVRIRGPIEWWMCVTTIGGQQDCFWVADPR